MAGALDRLVQELGRLPGIGQKTATRLAFHLLRAPAEQAHALARAIAEVRERIRPCATCGALSEEETCSICADARRDATLLCVLALPQEVLVLERTGAYRGRYHVLGGLLNPLDGVGPDDLRVAPLVERVREGTVREVILATSPSVEGDATALYLGKLLRPLGVKLTRIASGVPIGGELEFADGVTIGRALSGRREL